jgi:F-type H+-transporting ATPase subunit a
MVETLINFVKGTAGEKLEGLGNWFFMVFLFVLVSNLSGLLTLRPPTADWPTPFAFALVTFCLIQYYGIKYQKGKYIKSFFEPVFFLFPLNIIGELARPISLSFRMFGNILGGMILLSLLYTLVPWYFTLVVPAALHAYFDVVGGALQTYIFCVLSLAFIGAVSVSEGEAA